MAINIIPQQAIEDPSQLDKLKLEINNGDFEALKKITKEWRFEDETQTLRFALAVLTKAKNKTVYIDENGDKIGLKPAPSLTSKDKAKHEVNSDPE